MKALTVLIAAAVLAGTLAAQADAKGKGHGYGTWPGTGNTRSTGQHTINTLGLRGQSRATSEHALNTVNKATPGPGVISPLKPVPPGHAKNKIK